MDNDDVDEEEGTSSRDDDAHHTGHDASTPCTPHEGYTRTAEVTEVTNQLLENAETSDDASTLSSFGVASVGLDDDKRTETSLPRRISDPTSAAPELNVDNDFEEDGYDLSKETRHVSDEAAIGRWRMTRGNQNEPAHENWRAFDTNKFLGRQQVIPPADLRTTGRWRAWRLRV